MSNEVTGSSVQYFRRLEKAIAGLDHAKIEGLADDILSTSSTNGTIWLAGNGGSAATAGHMAVDLSLGVKPSGKIRAISLSDSAASITASGNDVSFDSVFARQVVALTRPGDLLIVISASGNSKNLVDAVEVARERRLRTAGILGFDGGALASLVDFPVVTKSEIGDYGVAEDLHLAVNHCLKEILSNER
jgi:D-sedoheptulose 7-phosphate isomerase